MQITEYGLFNAPNTESWDTDEPFYSTHSEVEARRMMERSKDQREAAGMSVGVVTRTRTVTFGDWE